MFCMTLEDELGNRACADVDDSVEHGGWDGSSGFADWFEDSFRRCTKELGGIYSVSIETDRLGRLDDALGRLDYLWGWEVAVNGRVMSW